MIRTDYNLLLVDDEEVNLDLLNSTFNRHYNTFLARDGESALEILNNKPIDVVITDQRMAGISGLDLLGDVINQNPDTVRILITGYSNMDVAVDSINKGRIHRYIKKPWDPDQLKWIVDQEIASYELILKNRQLTDNLQRRNEELKTMSRELQEAQKKLCKENLYLRREVKKRCRFEKIIGNSTAMEEMLKAVEQVLTSQITVLIAGETGTGKELVAQTIHSHGLRRDKTFFAQNCGALSETLLESELFGHKRGAFTGAFEDKKGIFEIADGGTIFFDEIGETSLQMQVKLLRVIEEGEIRPIGATKMKKKVDLRILSATNKDLRAEVEKGNFREDLFYRLNVFPIKVPSLRQRKEDIPLLALHFLEAFSKRSNKKVRGIDSRSMNLLKQYGWPGNIRELRNEIERAVTIVPAGSTISSGFLSDHLRATQSRAIEIDENRSLKEVVGEIEQRMIKKAIERSRGNKSKAALALGLSRVGLQKKLNRYEMDFKKTDFF